MGDYFSSILQRRQRTAQLLWSDVLTGERRPSPADHSVTAFCSPIGPGPARLSLVRGVMAVQENVVRGDVE